jgi:hypothetical protein
MKLRIESNDGEFSETALPEIEKYDLDDLNAQLNVLSNIKDAVQRAKDQEADRSEEPVRYRVVLSLHDAGGEQTLQYSLLATDHEREAKKLLAAVLAEVDFQRAVASALRPIDDQGGTRIQ